MNKILEEILSIDRKDLWLTYKMVSCSDDFIHSDNSLIVEFIILKPYKNISEGIVGERTEMLSIQNLYGYI